MNWLANRLAEPSTRVSLGVLAMVITQVVGNPPTNTAGWAQLAMGVLGSVAGVATKAPGSPDATPAATTVTAGATK